MSLSTRCPSCATIFKVVPDQLKVSDGWVRCGQCGEVFDASAHLKPIGQPVGDGADRMGADHDTRVELTEVEASDVVGTSTTARPRAFGEDFSLEESAPAALSDLSASEVAHGSPYDSIEKPIEVPSPLPATARQRPDEPAAVWLRRSPAARIVLNGEAPPQRPEAVQDAEDESFDIDDEVPSALLLQTADNDEPQQSLYQPAFVPPAPDAGTPEARAQAEAGDAAATLNDLSFIRVAQRRAFWQRPAVVLASAGLCLLLIGALALQVARAERDRLAAHLPGLRPMLESLCVPLQCVVAPLRRVDAIVIDSSAFNKISASLFQFEVEVRNTAPVALAMPALELTLTDTQDQTLLRRVLEPSELRAQPVLAAGGAWSGSLPVQLQAPLAADRVAGYRVLAFYP
ncbi:zinc-ribbon and DUF3426 domain-containing protein [Xylophilus sp. GOD-11R]|uniref:zinc-ribbon and DUF3426 domain-containing protein n=1 Tax=Xylophilus sp. GOD-11R TaxID=3089814 RepID=UPI00298D0FA1|nr:zinc-ribbon and DUF3426 domain-containing protein [Xylophilus sp. GOD-11R]WPB56166.1 zinc-ribbon and DUF3426 domain-containing protein [Xylophilus sp. GOD-11R]